MKKEKLIFVYPSLLTFIKTEIDILSDNFDLISINQKWSNKFLLPLNFVVQFFFLLFNLHKVNSILISFGGYSSFLPALLGNIFGKKVVIVVHGTDCVSFPEINYGNLRNPLMKFFTQKSYQLASLILPVSKSLVYTENSYFSSNILKFGYTHHLSNINTPHKVIHNGININYWQRDTLIDRDKNSFITALGKNQTIIKGVDLIVQVANNFPDYNFYIAGVDKINISNIPKNIFLVGRLSADDLKKLYSKTQFYLQLSNSEGFGVALCEAMLCECIPIVSSVNFLPNIIGDAGFVLKSRDPLILTELIRNLANSNISELEKKSRLRITENFTTQMRKEKLIKELKS